MQLYKIKLTKEEKKMSKDVLHRMVGRIGIMRTLGLLAKAIEPSATTTNTAYDKALFNCLHGHHRSIMIAKEMCVKRVKAFRVETN